jgi:hypothetical protein
VSGRDNLLKGAYLAATGGQQQQHRPEETKETPHSRENRP